MNLKSLLAGVAVALPAVVLSATAFAAGPNTAPDANKTATTAATGPLARVNGVDITEAELSFAEAEVGSKLASLPPATRKRALVEYLVEAHLFADEAKKGDLGKGKEFDDRIAYYQLRALRDTYYEKKLRDGVSDAQVKTAYDDLVAKMPAEAEIKARHILVKTEEEAKEIAKQLKAGAKFEDLAKKSLDTVSAQSGGDLGYFSKEQMVKPFEDVAFKLDKGQISDPVQTDFGWHVIQVEDKRNRPAPAFEDVKERLSLALLQNQLKTTFFALRKDAKIEMLDPELKKAVADEAKTSLEGGTPTPKVDAAPAPAAPAAPK